MEITVTTPTLGKDEGRLAVSWRDVSRVNRTLQ